jgi:hypothetical protein
MRTINRCHKIVLVSQVPSAQPFFSRAMYARVGDHIPIVLVLDLKKPNDMCQAYIQAGHGKTIRCMRG